MGGEDGVFVCEGHAHFEDQQCLLFVNTDINLEDAMRRLLAENVGQDEEAMDEEEQEEEEGEEEEEEEEEEAVALVGREGEEEQEGKCSLRCFSALALIDASAMLLLLFCLVLVSHFLLVLLAKMQSSHLRVPLVV